MCVCVYLCVFVCDIELICLYISSLCEKLECIGVMLCVCVCVCVIVPVCNRLDSFLCMCVCLYVCVIVCIGVSCALRLCTPACLRCQNELSYLKLLPKIAQNDESPLRRHRRQCTHSAHTHTHTCPISALQHSD